MKVKIDKEKCIGCGSCEAVCSDFFEVIGDEYKANFKKNEQADKSCIKEAADICPVQAIEIEE